MRSTIIPEYPRGFSIVERSTPVRRWLADHQDGKSFADIARDFNRGRRHPIAVGLVEKSVKNAEDELMRLDPSGMLRSNRVLRTPRLLPRIIYLMKRERVPLERIVRGDVGRCRTVGPKTRALIMRAFAELQKE
jgi:hypothetical protein